jgi:tetratricopeptide (TPR) repeat protein
LEVPGAWLAGAIFAVHPVMVESVAWITERKNCLSMVLFLSGLTAYGRFAGFWKEEDDPPRRWGVYVLAFILFTGALLTKTTAFSFPAVILLICWWKRGRIRWKADVLPTLPFFVVSIGFSLVTSSLEKNHVGAHGPAWDISFPQRCLIAGRVFWFYIGKLLWPVNLCFLYPRWQLNTGSWRQWIFPIAAVGVILTLFLARSRIGRGPITAALYFVGTLFPVLGFMNAYFMYYSFVCDHWTYLSSLGLIALAAAMITLLARRFRSPAAVCGFAAVVLPVLAILTWRQCAVYADVETLWRDTLITNPNAWLAQNNLGVILSNRGQTVEAVALYQESLRLNPDFAETYNNMGIIFAKKGKPDQAIAEFERALQLEPKFPQAHFNWAVALDNLGRTDEAIAQYQQALHLMSDFYDAHYNLGLILMRVGKVPEAAEQFGDAVIIQPDSVHARDNLAMALARQGNFEDAISQWQQILQIQPDYSSAELNWGAALEKMGSGSEAIGHYEKAIQLKPDFFEAQFDLGMILLRQGNIAQGIIPLTDAAQIQPDSFDAHNNLALALWQAGHAPEAIAQWEIAVRIKPNDPEALNDLAWALATVAPSQGGDSEHAVDFAKKACDLTRNQVPGYVDTLATAYVSAGRFNDAIAADQKAMDLARAAGQKDLVSQIQTRLQLYRSGHAYAPTTAVTTPSNP